jgi:hypothetical protein
MRHFRRIILAIALAISAGMMIPTASAQAGPGWVDFCVPPMVWSPSHGSFVPNPNCHKVFIEHQCPPGCVIWSDYWEQDFNPDWQEKYFHEWNLGLESLLESRLAQDPKLAEGLRFDAIERFLFAAEIRAEQGVEAKLFGVGWLDPESGKMFEGGTAQLWEVSEHLTAGQNLMVEGLKDPKSVDYAMEHLDAAAKGLGIG